LPDADAGTVCREEPLYNDDEWIGDIDWKFYLAAFIIS
jgi:hypothetical protein